MKGVRVMVAAAERLTDQDGFELHAYGAGSYLAGRGRPRAGPKLVSHEAFKPDDLDTVLADADVFGGSTIRRRCRFPTPPPPIQMTGSSASIFREASRRSRASSTPP